MANRPCLHSNLGAWRGLLAAALLIPLLAPWAARAGSITDESIWDQNDATQRALQRLPRGATVTGTRCQEFGVGGMDNPRYRCTVNYTETAPAP